MKIASIELSVFESPDPTNQFQLVEVEHRAKRRWIQQPAERKPSHLHVMHVRTDDGVEGVCTVGDARYRTMRVEDLEQLRILAIGESVYDRERLYCKLSAATRSMFTKPGWFGAFDNCLWDIAGKAADLPVYSLLGRARPRCRAYYNIAGGRGDGTDEAAVESAHKALGMGFVAVKDHFRDTGRRNIAYLTAVREAVGPEIDILHDAALAKYDFDEALRVGHALDELDYGWFEEPLPDAEEEQLRRLCDALDLPVMAMETMMHDATLCAQWLIAGATDTLRANARHGTTMMLKLAHLCELHSTRIEFNGPGGLFGLVHAHLCCAISNTSYYEYFAGGSRDAIGKEIGLMNPPVPERGYVTPPDAPGWGAQWDWDYFRRKRVAIL